MSYLFAFAVVLFCVIIVAGILWMSYRIAEKISFLNDPVYVPSTPKAIRSMLELAQAKPGDHVIDFGSGDGRIVIAFAQLGCYASGIEIDPLLNAKGIEEIT